MERQQRVVAARKALRKVLNAKTTAAEAGPPCRDCFYCGDEKPTPVCHHLVYAEPRYDAALGKYQGQSLRLISGAREAEGLCGPEGLLFEPKSVFIKAREMLTGERATAAYVGSAFIGLLVASVYL